MVRAAALIALLSLAACEYVPGSTVRTGEKLAAAQLIDPDSAKFRNVKVVDGVVCGEINGKNRMGAYSGFQRFYATPSIKSATVEPQSQGDESLDAMHAKFFDGDWKSKCLSASEKAANAALENDMAQAARDIDDAAKNAVGQ